MDSTLPCRLLPLPSVQRHHDCPGSRWPGRVKTGRAGRNSGKFCARGLFGSGGGGDGLRTVMRMVKLNSAIQNRSVRELLELIGDECLYFLSNLRSIDVSQLGKDMFLLLHALMVRHHVSFVLKPTPDETGFDLGVKWSLEWKGQKLPWDLDCNVSTTHVYRGLLLISQVNKTCVPLLQRILGIIQQNLDAVILTIVNKVLPEGTLDEKKTSTIIFCVIIGLVVMLLFYALFKNL
ncbi:hypothetical protein SEVIR_6G209700v4 [Setaria viridis]|uniref:Uncharacterized protein n=2 Tax=Setaria TaxID=4554 RepID=K3YJG4_SETIT|nr:uncharacterized protein LOC101767643 [Setaria italica]XP_034600520.1 uncharacterized protein LOC117861127 [Setaria viridis]RCV31743.1 hypothetical protein SETIT_6G202600v2 [Setaria italica]TKW11070.1 hypothetical protein SEVIR_6G209700v2 [Setaria viridis]